MVDTVNKPPIAHFLSLVPKIALTNTLNFG